jgi:hypothetical protein
VGPGSWPRPRLGAPVPAAAAPKPARLPEDECQQIDNSAPPGRLTAGAGRDGWTGPGNHVAGRSGRDAAHVPWFYGFRLAIRTELGSRIVRAWSIVPAAFNGREIAEELLETGRPRVTAGGQGKVITRWRDRIEATFGESTGQVGLARHDARAFWACRPAPRRCHQSGTYADARLPRRSADQPA